MRYLFVFVTSLFHFINLSAYAREFSVNQIYASLDTIDYFIRNKDFEEGLNVAKKTIYEAHKNNMKNVSELSYVYDKKADCEEALNLTEDLEVTLRKNVEIRENSLSPNDIMLAFSCSRLAFLLERKGNYKESVFYNEKASAIFRSLNEDKLYSGSVLSIASNYEKWSDSDDHEYSFKHKDLSGSSKSLLESSIEYYLKALELEEDPIFNHSSIHCSIAVSYEKIKDYKKAIFHRLKELALDPNDIRKARRTTLNALSMLYGKINDAKKSLEYAFELFSWEMKNATTEAEKSILHNQLAHNIILNIPNTHEDTELAKLYILHQEKAHSYNKKSYEISSSLASMYEKRSKIKRAVEVLEATVKARNKLDNETASMYLHLSRLYGKIGDHEEAREYLQKAGRIINFQDFDSHENALKHFLDKKILMDKSQNYSPLIYADILGRIEERYSFMQMFNEAEDIVKQQLKIYHSTPIYTEKELSEKHYKYAINQIEKGKVDQEINYKFLSETVKILTIAECFKRLGRINYGKGLILDSLKYFEDSLVLKEEAKGTLGVEEIAIYDYLILLNIHTKQNQKVDFYLKKRITLIEKALSQSLKLLPIERRLSSAKALNPFLFLGSSVDSDFVSTVSRRFKGIVLDSIINKYEKNFQQFDDSAKLIPKNLAILDFVELTKLLSMHGLGVQLSFEGSNCTVTGFSQNASEDVIKNLKMGDSIIAVGNELESMETTMGLNPDQIIDLISGEANTTVHLLIKRSKQKKLYSFQRTISLKRMKRMPFTGVTIYYDNNDSRQTWLELPSVVSSGGFESEPVLDFNQFKPKKLKQIYQSLIQPIIDKLPENIETLVICPDGQLNFLPFSCLIDENNHFLSEKYEVLHVSTLRDFFYNRESQSIETNYDITIFADPDFNKTFSQNHEEFAVNTFESSEVRGLNFSPLPGALQEASLLQNIVSKKGFTVNLHLKTSASETNLKKVKSPKILHLATHGFFESFKDNFDEKITSELFNQDSPQSIIQNPMNRSGLLLAGSRKSVEQRKLGVFVDSQNDGILFADEASQLDLSNTWLTVLSACDTGSGVARAGEGVLGLRRAFAMAGTQNLLLTLWPVKDSFTKDFMISFYKEALDSGNAPKAMAKVQTEWLVKLREERSISQAVELAGPFILTFRGNPELN